MTKIIVEEGWDAVCIPEGIYEAKVSSIFPKQIESDGETVDIFEWTFEITDTEETGTLLTDSSSVKFTPKSKAFQWYSAANGSKPEVGDEIELDTLADKPVIITVKNETKTIAGQKTETSRVSDVLASKKDKK